ncbi:hypothetical protein pb186bvf_006934 [Paramecium bursaria]
MQTEAQRFKELGNEQFKQGQFKEAIESYTNAIREDPSESIYFSNRARSLIRINQFQKAYEDALQSVELNDKNIKAHLLVGESLCYIAREQYQLQKIDQAIQRLTKALTLCTGQDKKTFEPDIKDRICKAKKLQWYLKQDEEIKENKVNYDQLKAIVQSDQGLSQEEKQITLQQMDKYMLLKPNRLQIPEYFCCQISKHLLIDPLTTQSGYSYERKELEKFLQLNPGKDPKTLQAIDTKIIYENFNLKQACDEFLQQNPWAYQYQENEDYKQLQF